MGNASGCSSTSTIANYICGYEYPVASFIASEVYLTTIETEVELTNTSLGAVSYVWTYSDDLYGSNLENPVHISPEIAGN